MRSGGVVLGADGGMVDGVQVGVDPAAAAVLVCHDGAALLARWVGAGRAGQTGHTPDPLLGVRLVLGHARPAGATEGPRGSD